MEAPARSPLALTDPQLEAINSPAKRIVVFASAGSGKTRVLTERILRRLHEEELPTLHVLATTFSRKAADELRLRLWRDGVRGIKAQTFHATALELITEKRSKDGRQAARLLSDRRRVLADARRSNPASIASMDQEISWAKANLLSPNEYAAARGSGRRPPGGLDRFVEVFANYEEARQQAGQIDFDDLIAEATEALESDSAFAAGVRWRWRHLFVDEFQDVNPAQLRFFEAIAGTDPDFFIVGDPDQSVYGFNGADPTVLTELPQRYHDVCVLTLSTNHRSTPAIVCVAAASLGRRPEHIPLELVGEIPRVLNFETEVEEAEAVALSIRDLERSGLQSWASFAVLARTNALLVPIQRALESLSIPFALAAPAYGPKAVLDAESPNDWREKRDENLDAVTLSTFHRAKGLEWPVVFVIGVSEGTVPLRHAGTNTKALAEERRGLYVALSRAELQLQISWSKTSAEALTAQGPREASRWLREINDLIEAIVSANAPLSHEESARRLRKLQEERNVDEEP
ncbi:MAG: ATP-dependent helicase [Actinomycetes bacterium]